MSNFEQGYQVYLEKCEQFGLQPINFHYFILNLSQEQLESYNHHAISKRGLHELTT